ncbi:hypothetical protein HQ560_09825 [bacterium]|nr:hypothetical protein [bacterium]
MILVLTDDQGYGEVAAHGDPVIKTPHMDALDPKDPLAVFEGRAGAVLWTLSAVDGKKISECKLTSPPCVRRHDCGE